MHNRYPVYYQCKCVRVKSKGSKALGAFVIKLHCFVNGSGDLAIVLYNHGIFACFHNSCRYDYIAQYYLAEVGRNL